MCTGVDIIDVVHLVRAVAQCRVTLAMSVETVHLRAVKLKFTKDFKIFVVLLRKMQLFANIIFLLCSSSKSSKSRRRRRRRDKSFDNISSSGAVASHNWHPFI